MACSCCYESAFTTPAPSVQPDICNSDIGAIVVTSDNTIYARINKSTPCVSSDFTELAGDASFLVQGTNDCSGGIGNNYSIASAGIASGILTLNGQPEHGSEHSTFDLGSLPLPLTSGVASQFYNPALDEDIGLISSCRNTYYTVIMNFGTMEIGSNVGTVDYNLQYRIYINGIASALLTPHRITQYHGISGTLRYALPTVTASGVKGGLDSVYAEMRLVHAGSTAFTSATWRAAQQTFITTTVA